jgi:hypothetical protein
MWDFWLWQTESVSVYRGSAESFLQNLVVFKLEEKELSFSPQINQSPFLYFILSLYSGVSILWFHPLPS